MLFPGPNQTLSFVPSNTRAFTYYALVVTRVPTGPVYLAEWRLFGAPSSTSSTALILYPSRQIQTYTTDPYWSSVVLFLHGDTLNESSRYRALLTNSNNVTVNTTIEQFGIGSLQFNGTSYLTTPASYNYAFGTSNFTIDFWVNFTSYTSTSRIFFTRAFGTTWAANMFTLGIGGSGNNKFQFYHNAIGNIIGTTTVVTNTWYYVALVRSGNAFYLYVNGQLEGTLISSTTADAITAGSTAVFTVGGLTTGQALTGYLDEFRVTIGVARYITGTPKYAFPDTLQYTDTRLLLHLDGNASDSSPYTGTLTNYGDTYSSSVSKFGSSLVCDGTANLITASSQTYFLGTNDFTIETWIYFTVSDATNRGIISNYTGGDVTGRFALYMASSVIYAGVNTAGTTSGTLTGNAWTHVAAVRAGTTLTLFVNGVAQASPLNISGYPNLNASNYICVCPTGVPSAGVRFNNGYLDEIRVVIGTALYTSNFTSPSRPFPNINTPLLY